MDFNAYLRCYRKEAHYTSVEVGRKAIDRFVEETGDKYEDSSLQKAVEAPWGLTKSLSVAAVAGTALSGIAFLLHRSIKKKKERDKILQEVLAVTDAPLSLPPPLTPLPEYPESLRIDNYGTNTNVS